MKDPVENFRAEVELMSMDEIQTIIDARTAEMNAHTMAGDEHRRHLVVLNEQKRERLIGPPPNKDSNDLPAPQRETTTDTSAPSRDAKEQV